MASFGTACTSECVLCWRVGCCFRRQREKLRTSYLLDYFCDFDLSAANQPLVLVSGLTAS